MRCFLAYVHKPLYALRCNILIFLWHIPTYCRLQWVFRQFLFSSVHLSMYTMRALWIIKMNYWCAVLVLAPYGNLDGRQRTQKCKPQWERNGMNSNGDKGCYFRRRMTNVQNAKTDKSVKSYHHIEAYSFRRNRLRFSEIVFETNKFNILNVE